MARIAFSYYLERDYAAAVEAVRRAVRDFAQFPMSYPWYAAALAQLGRTEQAQAVLGRVRAESPPAVELYTRGCPAWVRPQDHEHLLDGLRKASWQADRLPRHYERRALQRTMARPSRPAPRSAGVHGSGAVASSGPL